MLEKDKQGSLFLDRPVEHFDKIINSIRTKHNYLGTGNDEDDEEKSQKDLFQEIEFYGLKDFFKTLDVEIVDEKEEKQVSSSSSSKFKWQTSGGTSSGTTRQVLDKKGKVLKVVWSSCYNKIFVDSPFTKNATISIEVDGKDDTHGYIGVVNESFDMAACCCCSPQNAFYLHSTGTVFTSGSSKSSAFAFKPSAKQTIKMQVDAKKKTLTFNGKETINITGSTWRFFVGKCNGDTVVYKIK